MTKKKYTGTERRRCDSLNRYVDAIIKANSRIDVIRIDLYYKQTSRDEVTMERINKDINSFYLKQCTNTKGYIFKIEQGDEGCNHLHTHVIIFIDGQKTRERTIPLIARSFCDAWDNNITKGQGCSHNCNMKQYKNNGIGRIVYNDTEKIQAFKENVLPYFCKESQSIRTTGNKRIKALRRGGMPKQTNKGRPRKYDIKEY